MSMQSTTRESGNATGLPTGSLTRRSALRGSATAAAVALSLAALGGTPVIAQAAPVAVVSPASPDAALISHVDRLVALARRCAAAAWRAVSVQDAVTETIGFPPQPPRPSIGLEAKTEVIGDMLVSTLARPVHLPERDAILNAHDVAVAAYEQRREGMEQLLGLPDIEKRTDRMMRRCDRWTAELAAMKPETAAGLGAKGEALLALIGDDRGSREVEVSHRADLIMSLLADTVRLGAGGRA